MAIKVCPGLACGGKIDAIRSSLEPVGFDGCWGGIRPGCTPNGDSFLSQDGTRVLRGYPGGGTVGLAVGRAGTTAAVPTFVLAPIRDLGGKGRIASWAPSGSAVKSESPFWLSGTPPLDHPGLCTLVRPSTSCNILFTPQVLFPPKDPITGGREDPKAGRTCCL